MPKKENARQDKLPSPLLDNNSFIYILLGISVLFVLVARLRLLSFPFERDEGEYAYMGRLILDGHPPYTLAYNMKFPGTYYMYAIIMKVFGESVIGIHTGLAIITIASMILVFLISRNFVSKAGAVVSAASFGIIGTSWTLLGQAAHATHFVNFFALTGILILLHLYKGEKRKWLLYVLSGVCFSLAFICKQSGLFFLFFGIAIIITTELRQSPISRLVKNLSVLFLGFAIPVLIMVLYFYFFGDFRKFWFWTVEYLFRYGSQVPLSEAPGKFKTGLQLITANYSSAGYIALWVVSLAGIPLLFIHKTTVQNKILIFFFWFFSFLALIPGFWFREHYFLTLLPASALLMAVFFDFLNHLFTVKLKMQRLTWLGILVFLVLLGTGIWANSDYLFTQDNLVSCKKMYGSSPFVESVTIAGFLKQHTAPEDKIAVLGSEPQICFYAGRYSATGYIYTYSLAEVQPYALAMQKEMVMEIEANKPKYLLMINIGTSWLLKPNSETFIVKWADEYINNNYRMAGLYEVFPNELSSLKTGEEINGYQPQSQDYIYIFERNP